MSHSTVLTSKGRNFIAAVRATGATAPGGGIQRSGEMGGKKKNILREEKLTLCAQ